MSARAPASTGRTVDVIIPTWNGLPWLRATVDSVLNQTHQDLILYIIDDGSTDDTAAYAKSLKDPRVHYRYKANGGQATARNLGITMSKSPYVALIDADDLWRKDKLEKQLAILEKHPKYGMVYGFHKLINEKDEVIGEVVYNRSGELFRYLLGGNRISGSGSMVLVRRSVFEDVGVFHEDFLIGEDWEMWLRIAKKYQIYCIPEFLADLRVLQEGMQQNYFKMARGLVYMLPIMLNEFKPDRRGRARLKGVIYFEAALNYYVGGDVEKSRYYFHKLLRSNPARIERNVDYRHVYLRLLLGGKWHFTVRQKLNQALIMSGLRKRQDD